MLTRNRPRLSNRLRPSVGLVRGGQGDTAKFEIGQYVGAVRNPLAALAMPGARGDADTQNTWNSTHQRTPILLRLSNGNLAMIWRSMDASVDYRCRDVLGMVSADGGKTWSSPVLIFRYASYVQSSAWIDGISAVCDSQGRVHLLLPFFASSTANGAYTSSSQGYIYTDDLSLASGWSGLTMITASVNPSSNPWFVFGPHAGIQLKGGANAGALVFPIDFRTTVGGNSYAGLVYTLDRGNSWNRRSVNTGTAGNDNSNETAICEVGSSGRVYMNSRFVPTNGRKHAIVPDITVATLPDLSMMTDGAGNNINSNNCQGSVCGTPDGEVLVLIPSNNASNLRGHQRIFRSTDALYASDPTFPASNGVRTLCHRNAAYSGLVALGNTEFVAVHEHTFSYANEVANSMANWYEQIGVARFNKKWLLSSLADVPEVLEYHFNEATSGAVNLQGCQILDHGTHHNPIQGSGASGASWANGYVSFDGNNPGLLLQSSQNGTGEVLGGPWDWPAGLSLTLAFRMRVPVSIDAGDNVIIDNRANGSGVGYTIKIDSTGRTLTIAWCDGSHTNTVKTGASTVALNDNKWRTFYIAFDRVNNVMRAFHDCGVGGTEDDGVFVEAGSATANVHGAIVGGDVRWGSRNSGTTDAGKFDTSFLKLIRGQAKVSGHLSLAPATKVARNTFLGATPTTGLPSLANCVLGIGFWNGGVDLCTDRYGQIPGLLPAKGGHGCASFRDLITRELWGSTGMTRTQTLKMSPKIGLCVKPYWVGAGESFSPVRLTEAARAAKIATDVDFFQNTGSFAVSIVCEFFASTGATDVIMATGRETVTPAGFFLRRQSNSRLGFSIANGSGYVVDELNFGTQVFANNVAYYIGVDGTGPGGKLNLYYGIYAGNLVPPAGPLSTIQSAATIISDFSAGPWASTDPITIGARGDQVSRCPSWQWKNALIFNAPLGAAGHLALAQAAVLP